MRRISSSQMNEKRKKGVYFYCDEKWGPGHVCKKPKVYLLQVDEFVKEDQVHDAFCNDKRLEEI